VINHETIVTTNWKTEEPTSFYVVSIEDSNVKPTITIENEKESISNDNDDTVDSSEYKVLNVGYDPLHESTVVEISGLDQDLFAKVCIKHD